MVRNSNYETKNTEEFKDDGTVNELHGVISHKVSLPMKKGENNSTKLFSPNFMIRYAPGHMRNLRSKDIMLNYSNLYALNKTSAVDNGLSAILGIDYKISEKKGNSEIEKLSLSVGQIFSNKENFDMPSKAL